MRIIAVTICTMMLLSAGCASSSRVPNPAPVSDSEYDRVYAAAKQVLRDRGFEIARSNYRFGVIATEPRRSRTMLEPIRGNNVTLRRAGQSTLRQLRRIVTVQLQPAAAPSSETVDVAAPDVATTQPAPGAGYTLGVQVRLEAQQQPTRRLIGATGRRVFSTLDDVPQRWQERGITRNFWQTIDRDTELEQRLLQRMTQRAEGKMPDA